MKPLFLICLLAGLLHAQGVCVLDPIRTDATSGYVLFHFQGQYRVLSKGTVNLRNARQMDQAGLTVEVGNDGGFQLKGIRPGRYVLEARSPAMISAAVDYRYSPAGKSKAVGILILLGADASKPCGGGSIKIETLAKIREILSVATRE